MNATSRDADTRRPIPVTERTPVEPGEYLVSDGIEWWVEVFRDGRGWAHYAEAVRYWLPLPPAPGGDA